MGKRRNPWLMSILLSVILFCCTLLVLPIVLFGVTVLWWLAPTDSAVQALMAFIVILILGSTAGLTIVWIKSFDFGFRYIVIPFIILTAMCAGNPFNIPVINVILQTNISDIFAGRLGEIMSGLFFSVPMTAVIALTLGISTLVKNIKQSDYD